MLRAYDAQVRAAIASRPPAGVTIDRDGPLVRCSGGFQGFVNYRDLAGVEGDDLQALIDRTVAHYRARGESFEWKTHSHDLPADLTHRLLAAGFVPEERETVVVAQAARMATDPVLPAGVALREVVGSDDLRRIAAMETEVWGDKSRDWLADDLAARIEAGPDEITVLIAEAGDLAVSAAWLVRNPGTEFAGLWGGATLAAWRGQGIYKALIARRAQLAVADGVHYLQVDASEASRPILERLGFTPITTTTPYIWTPQPVSFPLSSA